jgi:hypothetical protein
VEIVTVVILGVYIKIFIPNYFRCEKYNMVSLFPNSLKEELKFLGAPWAWDVYLKDKNQ